MSNLQKFKCQQILKMEHELYELLVKSEDSLVLRKDVPRSRRLHVYYKRHCTESIINNMDTYSDGSLTILVEKDYNLQNIIYRIPGEGLFCKEDLTIPYKILDLIYE